MSYHLALAICKVPRTLRPEDLEDIRKRAGGLAVAAPEWHAELVEEVWNMDHDACMEIQSGLVNRGLEGNRFDEAEQTAINLLAAHWLSTAIETLLQPIVTQEPGLDARIAENRRTLPYDVQGVVLDGNRYLISGTVTSGDATESYSLVSLLAASGVCDVAEPPGASPGSPSIVDGGLRCPECGNTGETVGDDGGRGGSLE